MRVEITGDERQKGTEARLKRQSLPTISAGGKSTDDAEQVTDNVALPFVTFGNFANGGTRRQL